jgi:hypothetical protein
MGRIPWLNVECKSLAPEHLKMPEKSILLRTKLYLSDSEGGQSFPHQCCVPPDAHFRDPQLIESVAWRTPDTSDAFDWQWDSVPGSGISFLVLILF